MADFDIAVIGAGSAGLSITAVAAQLGRRVVLIERDRMGGDCLNAGCVPSKALLAAGHAAASARASGRFGIRLPTPDIDWPAVRAHVQGVIEALAPADSAERFTGLGATVVHGAARFVAPDAIEIRNGNPNEAGRRITANRFVIAAGSRAAIPALDGLAEVPFVTHTGLFELRDRPEHLIILGGGAIGLEMAQAHAGLGCRVTVVEAGTVAGREDSELAVMLRDRLAAEGVVFEEGSKVVRAEPGPTLVLADGRRVSGSHLLIAVGRRPNIEALDLAAAGVTADADGVLTDRGLRSLGNGRVYAAGDIANPRGLGPRYHTHVGSYHAAVLARRLLFRLPAQLDYAALPRVIYTAPELAQTGLTEAEARRAGYAPRVLRWTMDHNDRAWTGRDTTGLVKLVTAGGKLLGAGILAPHAGEMISLWTLAITRRVPLSALAGMVVPYPTLAEAGKRAAGEAFAARLFAPRTRALARALAWLG